MNQTRSLLLWALCPSGEDGSRTGTRGRWCRAAVGGRECEYKRPAGEGGGESGVRRWSQQGSSHLEWPLAGRAGGTNVWHLAHVFVLTEWRLC